MNYATGKNNPRKELKALEICEGIFQTFVYNGKLKQLFLKIPKREVRNRAFLLKRQKNFYEP